MSHRFVVLSDLHAHPWAAFARGEGIHNTRLERSLKILRESLARAKKDKIPWLFCGDLVHTAGYALNSVLSGVTSVLSDFPNVQKIVVWGNHDARGVGGQIILEQTIFGALKQTVKNLVVLEDGKPERIEGLTIAGAGYQPRPEFLRLGTGGDIGIFHQTVRGSRTPQGFELTEGISAEQLAELYRLSLVGHVHHSQRPHPKVFVPGSPEQHNFGDKGEHGWWLLDFPADGEPVFTFQPGGSPKFLTVDSPQQVKSDGNFYRVRNVSSRSDLPDNATFIAPEPTTVHQRDLLQNATALEQILQIWLGETPPPEGLTPQDLLGPGLRLLEQQDPIRMRPVRLKRLRLQNFCSYADQEFEVREGLWLVLGRGRDYPSNGAGKSTLFEAIFWLVFGKNTKDLSADEVVRWGASECSVSAEFDDGGKKLHVVRSRRGASTSLRVVTDEVEWEAPSATEMTRKLERYLGLTPEIYQNLGYFSQEKVLLFASATDGERKSVLADLIGLSAYQAASSEASQKANEAEQNLTLSTLIRDSSQRELQEAEQRLTEALGEFETWEAARRERLNGLRQQLTLLKQSDPEPQLRERFEHLRGRIETAVTAKETALQMTRARREQEKRETILRDVNNSLAKLKTEISHTEASLQEVREALGLAPQVANAVIRGIDATRESLNQARLELVSVKQGIVVTQSQLREHQQALIKLHELLSGYESELFSLESARCPTCNGLLPEDRRAERKVELSSKLDATRQSIAHEEEVIRGFDQFIRESTHVQEHVQKKIEQLEGLIPTLERGNKLMDTLTSQLAEQKRMEDLVRHYSEQITVMVDKEIADELRCFKVNHDSRLRRASVFLRKVIDTYRESMNAVEKLIVEVEAEANPHAGHVASAENTVSTKKQIVEVKQREVDTFQREVSIYEYWKRGFSKQGIQSLLMEEIASLFNAKRGDIFPLLTQGVYDVQFSTVSRTRTGELREKTEFLVYQHGLPIPYGALSGGQRRRVDLGIMITLAQAVSEWMGVHGVLGLLILDEVFGFLDGSGAEGLVEALRAVQTQIPTIYAVAHDTQLQSLFPDAIVVEQGADGISRITA